MFTPKSLSSCDKVTWKVALSGSSVFTTLSPVTTGNGTISYQFPATNQYVVCMTVTRTPPGSLSCTVSRCWTINVDCSLVLKPVDNIADGGSELNACSGSVVQNSGFTIDAEAGGMADMGSVWNWDYSGGNPEIVPEAGKMDTNFVRLRGNSQFSDLLFQDSLPLNQWDSIQFSMALRPIHGFVLPETELVVRLSSQKQDSVWCSNSDCIEIMRLPIPDLDSSFWLIANTFATVKNVAFPYLTIHVENPFVQNDVSLQSVVDIDNICLSKYDLVATKLFGQEVLKVRLFPNPNQGNFYIKLPQPATQGMQFQIMEITGRLLETQQAKPGVSLQTIQLTALADGLYFVQIIAEGKVLAVEKFVKQ